MANAKPKVFSFQADAGHAWLSVPIAILQATCTKAEIEKISSYSYTRGKSVYLEEDCDAGIFMNAYKAKHGDFKYKESFTERSPIRSYDTITKVKMEILKGMK